MQRLEKLDTSTIKQEVGNILNSYHNDSFFKFWLNKNRTFPELRTTQKRKTRQIMCTFKYERSPLQKKK